MSALSPRRLSMGAAAGLLVLLAGSENLAVAQTAAPRPAPAAAARPAPLAPVALAQAATPSRPTPRRRAAPRTYARPQALTTVQSANSSARDYPSAGAYVNAALYYDFEPGRLYTVHTSPRFLTAISLRPGEKLISKAAEILPSASANVRAVAEGRLPANAIWPWSPGRAGAMRTLAERHGIKAAVISAVDVINGLGRCLGMEVVRVPGATGYIDTNYEGKAEAAIRAIQNHDMVYVHVEAIDEVSHERNLRLKLKAIEDFDARIICPVIRECGEGITYVVLPDHPVPISLGRHTRTPVPLAICGPGIDSDGIQVFDEFEAPKGALGFLIGPELMAHLYPGAAK